MVYKKIADVFCDIPLLFILTHIKDDSLLVNFLDKVHIVHYLMSLSPIPLWALYCVMSQTVA